MASEENARALEGEAAKRRHMAAQGGTPARQLNAQARKLDQQARAERRAARRGR
jgi:hypothetical protein